MLCPNPQAELAHSRMRRSERTASYDLMVFSQLMHNDKTGNGSLLIDVISSEARNPYDVPPASSISGNEGFPLPSNLPRFIVSFQGFLVTLLREMTRGRILSQL